MTLNFVLLAKYSLYVTAIQTESFAKEVQNKLTLYSYEMCLEIMKLARHSSVCHLGKLVRVSVSIKGTKTV